MHGFFRRYKQHFLYAGIFSFFDNMLVLITPLYMLQLFDRVMTSQSQETLLMLTIAAVGGLLVMLVLETLRARLLGAAGVLMDQQLGAQVVVNLVKSAAQLSGRDYAQGARDVASLRNFLTGNGIFAFFDAPWALFFIIVIFIIHPLMGAVALVGALLLFGVAVLNQKITKLPLANISKSSRKSSRFIDISVRNAEVLSAMGMLEGVHQRWFEMNNEVLGQQQSLTRYTSFIVAGTKFLRQFIQVAMLGVGAYLVVEKHVTPGIMMAATIILGRALAPIEQAITTWKAFVEARDAYVSLDTLLANSVDKKAMPLPAPSGNLEVEKVSFVIPESRLVVIKGVSFSLESGEVLGIIGPSAAGKSTILRLLAGIWKPASGAVRLDGVDVSEWDRQELGQYIGYLPQDSELFSSTVAENIARLTTAIDKSEQIVEAAKMAGVHELILRLPNGYETEVGEGAYMLSGGQRQRIALARALFGKPRLVLLDEPNANLDGEGEIALLNAIHSMKESGMTVVIVTHKPAMLAHADKVLVMKDGSVEAFGPKNQIIEKTVRTASLGQGKLMAANGSNMEV